MIRDFVTEFRRQGDGRPWVVVGKGPTFGLAHRLKYTHWLFCLNDAAGHAPADFAHFTDWEAFRRVQDSAHPTPPGAVIVMPWHPHVDSKVGKRSLVDWAGLYPELGPLMVSGRLLSYRSDLDKRPCPANLTTVRVRKFSAVAAVNLLAMAGARRILLAGVDGGTKYADCFDTVSLLRNGRSSFDSQWPEIQRARKQFGVYVEKIADLKAGKPT